MSGKKKTCPVNWRAVAESYIEVIDKRLAESATVEIVTGPDVDREHMDDGTVDTVGVSATVRVRFPLPAVPDGLVLHAEDLHPAGDGWTSPAWEGVLDSLDDLPGKTGNLALKPRHVFLPRVKNFDKYKQPASDQDQSQKRQHPISDGTPVGRSTLIGCRVEMGFRRYCLYYGVHKPPC